MLFKLLFVKIMFRRKQKVIQKLLVLTIVFIILSTSIIAQVKLQTGSAELSIPVYSFSDNISRLSLNISLDYSSGNGILVDNISGPIGTGWSLNGIPMIIRKQRELPDDQIELGTAFTIGTAYVGLRGCPKALNYYPMSEQDNCEYEDPKVVTRDKMYDEFTLLLGNRTITFYLRAGDTWNQGELEGLTVSPVQIVNEGSNIKIKVKQTSPIADNIHSFTKIKGFEVTDGDGITYEFYENEHSKQYQYRTEKETTLPKQLAWKKAYEIYDENNEVENRFVTSTWHITKIADKKNNREVLFTYNSEVQEFKYFGDLYTGGTNETNLNSIINGTTRKNYVVVKQIHSISLPTNESVDFIYGHSRKDIAGTTALTEILVKNAHQSRMSKFLLNQSYFVKNQIEIPSTTEDEKWSRLCLTSVKKYGSTDDIYEPSHSFDYYLGNNNTENFVPPAFFHAKDPWGYYNGDACGVAVNEFLKDIAEIPIGEVYAELDNWVKIITYNQNHTPHGEYEITPTCKEKYAQNGLLKKYTNPLGGSIDFLYEQNMTRPPLNNGPDVITGGVHVSKIIESNPENTERIITQYSYTMENGNSSLWGIEQPRFTNKITKYFKKEGQHWCDWALTCCYEYGYPCKYDDNKSSIKTSKQLTIEARLAMNAAFQGKGKGISFTGADFKDPITFLIRTAANIIFGCLSGDQEQTTVNYFASYSPTNFSNLLPAQFSRIEVRKFSENNSAKKIGKVIYEFTSDLDFPVLEPIKKSTDINFDPYFFTQKQRCYNWMYGLPRKTTLFKLSEDGTAEERVKSIENSYTRTFSYAQSDYAVTSCNCNVRYLASGGALWGPLISNNYNPDNYTLASIPGALDVDICPVESGAALLTNTVEKFYAENTEALSQSTSYEYTGTRIAAKLFNDSKGRLLRTKYYYYDDFVDLANNPNDIFGQLYFARRQELPIAEETWQKKPGQEEQLLSTSITELGVIGNGDHRPVRTFKLESSSPVASSVINYFNYTTPPLLQRNTTYIKPQQEIIYDGAGLPVQINDIRGNRQSTFVYDYDNQYKTASVVNAPVNEVGYSSFETPQKLNLVYSEAQVVVNNNAPMGKKCYQLDWNYFNSITTPISLHKKYIVSFWATSYGFAINGTFSLPDVIGPTINGWTYYQYTLQTTTGLFYLVGDCLIDELRIYPRNARMSTSTYEPGIGKTSECDQNNRITYFEYDGLQRLKIVRDENRDILKTYEYHYKNN